MLLELNTTLILRPIGEMTIIAFDDALRAARASVLAVTWPGCHFDLAQNSYLDPPTASFCKALFLAPPTLAEISMVCKLVALVRCWQSLSESTDLVCSNFMNGDGYPEAVECFHRASYRFLFMGYLFSGAYLGPVAGLHIYDYVGMEPEVRRYPVYHKSNSEWRYQQLHRLFGGFIEWIVADGASQGAKGGRPGTQPDKAGGSHSATDDDTETSNRATQGLSGS